MKKSKLKKFVLPIACTLLLFACSKDSDNSKNSNASSLSEMDVSAYISENISYEEEDYRTNWEEENPIFIALDGDKVSYDESTAIMTSGSTVTIRSGGVYVLSGDLDDGQIVVDAPDTGKVQLVLNEVDIHNSKSAAIFIKEAEDTIITLAEDTENLVSDGETYTEDDGSGEPNAAIFSKDDLTINGTGTLEVVGNYDNGIGSKDDLRIMEGNIKVTAVDDAILGRDLVAIKSGTVEINAGGDGIKSTNTNDTKGIIAIEDGTFNIKAGTDGIQAESSLYVADGDFTITAGGGSPETIEVREEMMGGQPWGNSTAEETEAEETPSTKGLKANKEIAIGGGTFEIDTLDDAVHSDTNITIMDGEFTILTGDDGIHAENELLIANGTIDIKKSYEGIEGKIVTINNGDLSVITADDGINVSDGSSESAAPGGGMGMESAGNALLTINGGNVYVEADGDGLDANGSIVVTGGTIIVNGPTNAGNGALDYDGSLEISGGTLIALGSSGMAQTTSDTSKQNSIMMTYSETQKAGTIVHLEDSDGNTIVTVKPNKDYQTVVISTSKIAKESTYVLYSGGSSTKVQSNGLSTGSYEKGTKVVEYTVSDTLTYVDESGISEAPTNNMGGPGGGGGRGQGGGTPPSGNFEGGRGEASDGNQNGGQTNDSSSQ
ncbi:carbohydrate-binding domain-containing protein [Niallia sp. JL1B1071]|uniref:carbohydrate-binding domain-containing protein n=1 Tax=Niallia tiangongensis TaxID=3237105 RepID=UPI0037DD7EE9